MDWQVGHGWLAPEMVRWLLSQMLEKFRSLLKLRAEGTFRFDSWSFLWLQSKKSPMEFADEVVEEADQYNGFNLVLADLCSRTMVYVTNRPKEDRNFVTEVSPGIHVLSNAQLDSPWPKAQLLGDGFRETLMESSGDDLPIKLMVEKLMTNTVKVEDESLLPHIYPPELEYHLSSIFVEKAPPLGHYGTRSTSALSVKTNGEVSYCERYLENQVWKEGTVTYQIGDVCNL
ncbi:unnamed protein product [Malus baccata var. baccata]